MKPKSPSCDAFELFRSHFDQLLNPHHELIVLANETGNRQYLNDSVLYNEDDCRATKLIKDWMASGGARA